MIALALLLIGYSVFCAVALALTHCHSDAFQEFRQSRLMGLGLLVALSSLQLAHFAWLYLDLPLISSLPYRLTLFSVAPAFLLFSQPLLQRQTTPYWHWPLHALPALLALLLPAAQALPLAFIIGAAYLLWLGRTLHALRQARANFRREIGLLGGVFMIAIGVSVLGLLQSELPDKLFYSLYACAIGLAFLLVQIALSRRPQLPAEVAEVAQNTYVNTTLTHVDCDAVVARLTTLMTAERLYQTADLSLPSLAELLTLSPHQLSELLNSRIGIGFSRYLREQRVAAAKAMLLDEPSASVLSVGLSVGFTSQSNFYEAFRELEGMTPGQYRKLSNQKAP
ncbi:helix-turn-helix domain-containing protein [Jeongeupia wiesaeckerbachi]|uniref:AraC family transcriptional regulator n=1 Tax=Jeongeupia wiesaeckerbachi TaxID=3051218 RepID=UPI003D805319